MGHPSGDDATSSSETSSESEFEEEEEEEYKWIPWFCQLKGNEFFLQVETEFIEDSFNLTGINAMVPYYYNNALEMILDSESTGATRAAGGFGVGRIPPQ